MSKKKKLKKQIKKLNKKYAYWNTRCWELESDLRVLVYEPGSYGAAEIKLRVRLDDDMEQLIMTGSVTSKGTTGGIWKHITDNVTDKDPSAQNLEIPKQTEE